MGLRRSALIIATDEYRDPKLRQLRAPSHDAEQLADVLADVAIGNFEVDVCLNEPEYKLRRRLAAFFGSRVRDELLLIHFSCHGIKDDDGALYFATADTEVDHLDSTAIASEFVNRQMDRSRSRRIALFLDCCYSGAFSGRAGARGGEGVDLAQRFEGRGQVVITASNAMEYAFEGDELTGQGSPSVFTSALVEGLKTGAADRDGDGRISIDEIYDYVYDEVRDATPSQTPSKWTYDLQGDLYIARNPNPQAIEPAELPQDLQRAMENPFAAIRAGAVQELKGLLIGGQPRLALAAQVALAKLVEDDSRKVAQAADDALRRGVVEGIEGDESTLARARTTPDLAERAKREAAVQVPPAATEGQLAPGEQAESTPESVRAAERLHGRRHISSQAPEELSELIHMKLNETPGSGRIKKSERDKLHAYLSERDDILVNAAYAELGRGNQDVRFILITTSAVITLMKNGAKDVVPYGDIEGISSFAAVWIPGVWPGLEILVRADGETESFNLTKVRPKERIPEIIDYVRSRIL
jgi:hypothetical protein